MKSNSGTFWHVLTGFGSWDFKSVFFPYIFMGTVEGYPTIEDIKAMLLSKGIKKGTAEYDDIVEIWIDHLKGVMSHF